MYLRSLFPPLPPIPTTNYHNVAFGDSEQADYVMLIDAVTGQQHTRFEVRERIYDGATALGAAKNAGGLGFTSNDMIGIISDNCIDYIVLIHALLVITTPFALFSSHATPRELTHCIKKAKPTYMFVHASLLPQFLTVARGCGFPEDKIYILEGKFSSSPRVAHFGQLIDNVRRMKIPREPVRQANKDTLAYLVFSSGTSGLPKAVMTSHGNMIFSIFQTISVAQEAAKIRPPTVPDARPVFLAFLPLFHTYGLYYGCLIPPLNPTTVVVMPRWNLNMTVDAIPKYRVTSIPAIPSIIHQLVNSPKFQETDLSSLMAVGSGAAHLPPKLNEKFNSLLPSGVATSEGYGMSEATISLIGRPALPGLLEGRVESIPGSSGILLPGVEALILRPDGTHCVPHEAGDLYVKGGNISPGYWDDPEATKASFVADGWLKTGDRFSANTNGTLWFQDRAKDTLKVSGLQVSPAEIEDTLMAEPEGIVNDVAVAGVQLPGARTSDDMSPRAWVVLSVKGQRLSEQEARERLESWAKANLSKYKWLRGGIQFVVEIPKTPTGKILRRVLQQQFASEAERAKL